MSLLSEQSEARLLTCDMRLHLVFREVVKHWPCVVIAGHRGQEAQDLAFREGKSQLRWPNGNHNSTPSRAVDVAPAPIDWQDVRRFREFAGVALGIAHRLGVRLRWGGDWDGNPATPNRFNDLVHFELLP